LIEVFEADEAEALRRRFERAVQANDGTLLEQCRRSVLTSVATSVRYSGELTSHGFTVDPPGLPAVSYDVARSEYVGLHIDTWARVALKDRQRSPIRLCLNLGPESRFFLFLNLSANELTDAVDPESRKMAKDNANLLLRSFFQEFPDYPVGKLLVKPGEAYMAPTENVAHDGYSLNQNIGAMHIAFRGNFEWRGGPALAAKGGRFAATGEGCVV